MIFNLSGTEFFSQEAGPQTNSKEKLTSVPRPIVIMKMWKHIPQEERGANQEEYRRRIRKVERPLSHIVKKKDDFRETRIGHPSQFFFI